MTSVDTHLSSLCILVLMFLLLNTVYFVDRLVYFNLTEEGDVCTKEIDFEKNMTIIEISPEIVPSC